MVFNLAYDLAGRRTTLSYPNEVSTSYAYNEASFLTGLVARDSQQTTINSFTYTPDGMGNRTSMTDLVGQHNYTYDNIYQLTQATHLNMATEQFGYDAVGNKTSSGQPTPSLSTTLYAYDYENRLTDVSFSDMAVHYKYDPFGRRIEKNVDGTITKYVYDGPNIVTQYDGDWNVQGKYLFTLDIDDPLMVQQGDNLYYYHKDGLGSVVNLTDSSQSIVKGYTYKSFGDIYSETGSVVQPFTFTGREYDPESGLYYYRARYYDPRAGRFLTRDPIGFAGGDVNLYRYVHNNPVKWADPLGLQTREEIIRWSPMVLPIIAPIVKGAIIVGGQAVIIAGIVLWPSDIATDESIRNDTWFANESRQNEATAVNGEGKSCPVTDLTPTGGKKIEPSTKKGNKKGKSVQVGYIDPQGRPVTEHTVYDPNGNIIHGPHFRPGGFK